MTDEIELLASYRNLERAEKFYAEGRITGWKYHESSKRLMAQLCSQTRRRVDRIASIEGHRDRMKRVLQLEQDELVCCREIVGTIVEVAQCLEEAELLLAAERDHY
jgi:hypothetical protein